MGVLGVVPDVPYEYGHSTDVMRMSGYSTKSSVSKTKIFPCSRDGFIFSCPVYSTAKVQMSGGSTGDSSDVPVIVRKKYHGSTGGY